MSGEICFACTDFFCNNSPDYSKPEGIQAFEKATGIKVTVTNYSINQECMNKLRATRAKGFDIAQPSLTEFALLPIADGILRIIPLAL
ncbi:hypothetical protein [Desulfocicer niacini]